MYSLTLSIVLSGNKTAGLSVDMSVCPFAIPNHCVNVGNPFVYRVVARGRFFEYLNLSHCVQSMNDEIFILDFWVKRKNLLRDSWVWGSGGLEPSKKITMFELDLTKLFRFWGIQKSASKRQALEVTMEATLRTNINNKDT